MRYLTHAIAAGILLLIPVGTRLAAAQARSVSIGGYGLFGGMNFAAAESLKAVSGTSRGTLVGGGATVGLPWGGLFVDVGAWRVSLDGQRVFVSNGTVYPFGIPVTITVTPLEFTGGWQFKTKSKRFTPYVGIGVSSYAYTETSSLAAAGEDVSDRFSGYHLIGGVRMRVRKWLTAGGEVAWTTIPHALAAGGVSKEFGEDNLGGTSIRLKVTVGR